MTAPTGPDGALLATALEQCGATLTRGLSGAELVQVEARFGFSFAPDHRLLLSIALPLGGRSWPDWRDAGEVDLRKRLAWPVEGILFDVEDNTFWRREWGERPTRRQEALAVAARELQRAPALVPIYGHRYVPTDPALPGNPVLSCYQTDIIFYGNDLLDWFSREFHNGGSPTCPTRRLPFWADLMDEANEG